jgi:hypothetical protein
MSKPNGFVLHETPSVVVIAIGFNNKSTNTKTGAMIQIYTLLRNTDPINGSRTGADSAICFDCKFRGVSDGESVTGRLCYVTLMHGPLAVYRAYRNGSYPKLAKKDIPSVVAGRSVRFGAYGEGVLLPKAIALAIIAVAKGWTWYTHQWRNPKFAWVRPYAMASCDSVVDQLQASAQGWRTFRVSADDSHSADEINCPASLEAGHRTECERCLLCQGASKVAKNIYIQAHGTGSSNAFKILQ